ncbi:MAG TPA: hypothetical protein PLP61_02250 [Nocardioides sp.]|uniref:DUF7144 family membrane protein n=1 Tax=Nocardioides sp. TaxID=35761 RepID=UPI002C3AD9CC|nr:hypothetical protein [Nocardioides sp.]HQR25836.1 hypothetical protein [Nocardioides sp.]
MSTNPEYDEMPEPTRWVGWVIFGAIMMIMVGVFGALAGLVGIFKEEVYLVPSKDLLVTVDYTTWGWVHLLLGLLVLAAGVGLLAGRTWARIVGVIAISLHMVVNFVFLAAYPLWSLTMIALGTLVLFAIIAHGREIRY